MASDAIETAEGLRKGVVTSIYVLPSIFELAGDSITDCRCIHYSTATNAVQRASRGTHFDAFAYVAGLQSGIFVGRLVEGVMTDHAVVVDANRRVILDSAEASCMRLTAQTLSGALEGH